MALAAELLWEPLLEAAAQTIVGAIGGYAFTQALSRATRQNTFDGAWTFGAADFMRASSVMGIK